MCAHGIRGHSLRQIRSRDAGLGLPFLKLYNLEYQKGQIIKFKFEGTFLLRHRPRVCDYFAFLLSTISWSFYCWFLPWISTPRRKEALLVVEAFLGLITETISLGIFFSSESFVWKWAQRMSYWRLFSYGSISKKTKPKIKQANKRMPMTSGHSGRWTQHREDN